LSQKKQLKTKQNAMLKKIQELQTQREGALQKKAVLIDRLQNMKHYDVESLKLELIKKTTELELKKKYKV